MLATLRLGCKAGVRNNCSSTAGKITSPDATHQAGVASAGLHWTAPARHGAILRRLAARERRPSRAICAVRLQQDRGLVSHSAVPCQRPRRHSVMPSGNLPGTPHQCTARIWCRPSSQSCKLWYWRRPCTCHLRRKHRTGTGCRSRRHPGPSHYPHQLAR